MASLGQNQKHLTGCEVFLGDGARLVCGLDVYAALDDISGVVKVMGVPIEYIPFLREQVGTDEDVAKH